MAGFAPGRGSSLNNDSGDSLRLAYQRLLALERFKSGFLARTSHELRSPISAIVSLHQLILEDLCEGPEEEKEFLGQSKAAALKMLALFDQIAAVSKLDVGREQPKLDSVDLSFLLPEVEMATTLQAANQNVRYSVESPADELEILTDAKWLKTLLISLLEDAVFHTKMLRLAVETSDDSVVIVVECDRAAEQLQQELEMVASAAESADVERSEPEMVEMASSPAAIAQSIENIKLSTGLILAMVQVALPLIKGDFEIVPHPDSTERSCLRCIFPSK